MEIAEIYKTFESLGNTKTLQNISRLGVVANTSYGITIPHLRNLAKEIGTNHQLALKMWEENCHERNFVKKAVNWAVRQIGKRSRNLNEKTIELAKQIHATGTSSAKWIASDALRELTNEKIKKRIKR